MNNAEITLHGHLVFEVNNYRAIRLKQKETGGSITVRVLSAPNDVFGHRDLEYEYEISPANFVMMLNWYRFQKAHGNDALML